MKKLLVIPLAICTLSFIVNLASWFSGDYTLLYDRISLISSTIAWFSLLLTLYYIAGKQSKPGNLKKINIVLLLAMFLPLFNIFKATPQSLETSSTGILPAVFEFLNYAWRILLALIALSVLMKKASMLKITLILLSALVLNSFFFRVKDLLQMISQAEQPAIINQLARILDPVGIILLFLLIMYVVSNRKYIADAFNV